MAVTELQNNKTLRSKPQTGLKTGHTDVDHPIHGLGQMNQTMIKGYNGYIFTTETAYFINNGTTHGLS